MSLQTIPHRHKFLKSEQPPYLQHEIFFYFTEFTYIRILSPISHNLQKLFVQGVNII